MIVFAEGYTYCREHPSLGWSEGRDPAYVCSRCASDAGAAADAPAIGERMSDAEFKAAMGLAADPMAALLEALGLHTRREP